MNIIVHEANGVQIGQRPQDGYINATEMSHAYYQRTGKRRDVYQWFINKRTQESVKHLSTVTGIPVTALYQAFKGGNKPKRQSTWIHPRLAIRFAIWLDDDFGYMVETWVMDWLTTQQQPITPQPQAVEIQETSESIEDISVLIEQLEKLEREIILALGHCKVTHSVVEQRLVDFSMNKIVDYISHQQKIKLQSALSHVSLLREMILSIDNLMAIPQSFQMLAEEIELIRTEQSKVKETDQTSSPEVKTSNLWEVKSGKISKQAKVNYYLDYLETLPENHSDLAPENLTNKEIATRLDCEESTVRRAKTKRGIKPRHYKKTQK